MERIGYKHPRACGSHAAQEFLVGDYIQLWEVSNAVDASCQKLSGPMNGFYSVLLRGAKLVATRKCTVFTASRRKDGSRCQVKPPISSLLHLITCERFVITSHSELLAVIWATVAVNQLTETVVEPSATVWELLKRPWYDLAWAATNSHFLFGQ